MLFNTTEWSSKNGSRSVADPALTCRAIVIPPLNGAGVVRESVCRRDKRASAKMRKGGILQLGKADSSRLKPVRNDKGEIEWLVTYAESQRWKRCATQKLSRARAPAPHLKKLSSPASGGIFGKAFIRWTIYSWRVCPILPVGIDIL